MIECSIRSVSCTVPITLPGKTSSPLLAVGTKWYVLTISTGVVVIPLPIKEPDAFDSSFSGL